MCALAAPGAEFPGHVTVCHRLILHCPVYQTHQRHCHSTENERFGLVWFVLFNDTWSQ